MDLEMKAKKVSWYLQKLTESMEMPLSKQTHRWKRLLKYKEALNKRLEA